ncbi:MAG: arsenate reductase [Acidobacteria bacterium]|nr:arsenate reductase [Acidobacteriota bacterium]
MAGLFRENGVRFEQVDYFRERLTAADVKMLLGKLRIPAFGLLRTKEKEFKERGFTPETPEDEIIAAIVANPGLLNRPIVVAGDRAVIARPIEKALDLIE